MLTMLYITQDRLPMPTIIIIYVCLWYVTHRTGLVWIVSLYYLYILTVIRVVANPSLIFKHINSLGWALYFKIKRLNINKWLATKDVRSSI